MPDYFKKILILKNNCDGSVGKEIYRDKIGVYLSDIKVLMEGLQKDSN